MMKNFTKLFALVAVMSGFSLGASAQNTDVSPATDASAVIVAPITISIGSELNFGQVVSDALAVGTVTVDPAGVRTAGGAASFSPGTSGGPVASTFTVTGETGYTYTVTLPSTVTLTGTSGAALTGPATMTADTFTKSIVTGSLASGTEDFTVGATLNVGIAQAAGAYSGTYTVQVDYE